MNEQLIKLGQISKIHGFKGDLVFRISNFHSSVISDFSWVFISMHDEEVPYQIIEFQLIDTSAFIAHLKGVEHEEMAKKFVGKDFFMNSSQLKIPTNAEFRMDEIVGWTVFSDAIEIGKISEIIENKTQIIIQVEKDRKEFLIPLVDDFIKRIDTRNQIIIMSLPEGLLEL
jgi:16S rRNA processing protein RimM